MIVDLTNTDSDDDIIEVTFKKSKYASVIDEVVAELKLRGIEAT